MRRLAPLTALGLALALSACDPSGSDTKTASASPSLSAPEPVNVYRPSRVSTWTPENAPAARTAYAAAQTSSLPSLEGLSAEGAKLFDGNRPKIVHRAGMSIDTDGRISDPRAYQAVAARDRWRSNSTSLRYSGGSSIDPTRVPYVVLPTGYRGANLGDMVYVQYRGRGAWAVVGDYGPSGKFGEGSSALAAQLGINPDGHSGGVESGVTYTIYPGTGRRRYAGEADLMGRVRTASADLSGLPASVDVSGLPVGA